MLNLFSAEKALETTFSDEQIRTVVDALRREGKAQEIIYHTEDHESFRYVITTEITSKSGDQEVQATTSVDKFKIQEEEFLEFVQETLDGGLVREKKYTFPLQEEHDKQACLKCLQPIASRHLRCINKIERILSRPKPQKTVQKSSRRTILLLFALLITLIASSLFFLRPLMTNKHSANLTLLFNTMDVQVVLGTKQYTSKGNRLDLNLPLGRYRLQAIKSGFKPVRQDIFLTADEEVGIRLEELHTLTVYADMEGTRVLLNNNIIGILEPNKPLELSLAQGEYELALSNPAVSAPFEQKILLKDDQVIRAELPHPQLTIRTNVDDVILTVGEKEYPVPDKELSLKLPLGSYQIIASKPGYSPVIQEIILEDQDQVLPINLEILQYQLSITSNVANSSISVSCANGEKYFGVASSDTPFQVTISAQTTSAQTCNILAEKQGYQHIRQEVNLTADQDVAITLDQLFLITIYTNLDLSTVLLDNKEVGKAGTRTPAVLSLPHGAYTITISHSQARNPVEQQLKINKDQRLNINLPLPRLTVTTNVAGTTLLIDEKKYQVPGKEMTVELPQGNHDITAQKKGYITIQRKALVRDKAQTFFELKQVLHPLSIRSNIDKTAIYVKCKGGKEYSGTASPKAPFHLQAVAGLCTVSASHKGYKEISKTLTLPHDREIFLDLLPEAIPEIPEKVPKVIQQAGKKDCQNELSVGMPELCD
ncbi:MAG: PEGA domain-containing protein [Candidatus Electrothrix sp. MAN1_4]|nr:PEGA domain-containing protein [Candidatus Electrothrix sp. MAN1_4]